MLAYHLTAPEGTALEPGQTYAVEVVDVETSGVDSHLAVVTVNLQLRDTIPVAPVVPQGELAYRDLPRSELQEILATGSQRRRGAAARELRRRTPVTDIQSFLDVTSAPVWVYRAAMALVRDATRRRGTPGQGPVTRARHAEAELEFRARELVAALDARDREVGL